MVTLTTFSRLEPPAFSTRSRFCEDLGNFGKVVELRCKYFAQPYPADTIVEVTSLALPELMIEIEAIAVADAAAERV